MIIKLMQAKMGLEKMKEQYASKIAFFSCNLQFYKK